MRRDADYYEGCLLGGALGDALGAPVEFINYQQILHRYGAGGIQRPQEEESGLFEITDDTQMTLFTAEGLLPRANRPGCLSGCEHQRNCASCLPALVAYSGGK
ncbi:MAG: ADP-ribosylglycohydrolase family protein [Syntrophomonadaceae bacterium]